MSKTRRSSSTTRRGSDSRAREGSSANNPLMQILQAQRKLLSAGIDSLSHDTAGRPHVKGVPGPLQDGFRRLEQVFDDRVAAALQRIGMPSAETLRELIERVDRLSP
ncbi:MAG: phasin family protein, partial [Vicinamibacterales bacterium]